MMKIRRKYPSTAPVIKYDFSYSVNRKTIPFLFLSRKQSNRKKRVHWLFGNTYMEKFLMWQRTFLGERKGKGERSVVV
ncbi:hypothetical protein CER18_08170 [Bartonella tribocorum]|uniref:Uncharacterized protein n=1 Tax=Bartonella tribocorum TaxID=85701 RepID=A0A2N9Y8U2_9HYPH|nr:hypothetical protein CER18_08170 [Bartonella tribocorum]